MAKELTLDETWKQCLRMWKWIAKRVKAGRKEGVEELKEEWLEKNWTGEPLKNGCFFCEYAQYYNTEEKCGCAMYMCPGRLVNKRFSCCSKTYHYEDHPIAFYNKLVSLNEKRLKGKEVRK